MNGDIDFSEWSEALMKKINELASKPKKPTNADRIRSMSDEELANYIMNNCDNPISEKNNDMCDFCEKYEDELAKCDREGCKKAIVKWLQSEVEG